MEVPLQVGMGVGEAGHACHKLELEFTAGGCCFGVSLNLILFSFYLTTPSPSYCYYAPAQMFYIYIFFFYLFVYFMLPIWGRKQSAQGPASC